MKIKGSLIILLVVLLGCNKDKVNVAVNGALTNCPPNTTCTYSYYDDANFTNWTQPVAGSFRVFWYKSIDSNLCSAGTAIYFKTAMSDNDFDIGSSQIAAGQGVGYNFECPCCDYAVLTKPIGGEIKGKKTDAGHWLVNASIIMGTAANSPTDTLTVNQYFTLEKIL